MKPQKQIKAGTSIGFVLELVVYKTTKMEIENFAPLVYNAAFYCECEELKNVKKPPKKEAIKSFKIV